MKKTFYSAALLALSLLLASCQSPPIQETLAPPGVETGESQISTPLPAITEGSSALSPIPMPLLGAEIHDMETAAMPELFKVAGGMLVRHNALLWSDVETSEGVRDWSAVAELEVGLANTGAQGLKTILIVRSAPEWAQAVDGSFCGPVKAEKLNAYATFLSEAVRRYSAPPYSVKYWELGNEPDVDPSLVPPFMVFGCWGNQEDPFYGGSYYAEMLKVVYPAIKAADPEAQVLIGGLLLDCDPTNPPEGKDCKPSKFLEGILANGGGDYFDIVSFHGYPSYSAAFADRGVLFFEEHFPTWEARGGVVQGKANFLREVMARYNVNKPLFHTEGALTCPECDPAGEEFFEAQADYVVMLYVRNWANGIRGTTWYTLDGPGWRFGGLLDENQQPKPAYNAFGFLASELNSANYIGSVTPVEGIAGYEFTKDQKVIWVLWSLDGSAHPVSVTDRMTTAFDKYGNTLALNPGEVLVQSPIYIELTP